MSTTPPEGTAPDVLGDKVNEWLEQDGKLPESDWRKMVAYMMRDMRADIKEIVKIKQDVSQLRKKNLVIWAEKHPKWAAIIIVPIGTVFIIHFIEYLPTIERALEVVAKWLL